MPCKFGHDRIKLECQECLLDHFNRRETGLGHGRIHHPHEPTEEEFLHLHGRGGKSRRQGVDLHFNLENDDQPGTSAGPSSSATRYGFLQYSNSLAISMSPDSAEREPLQNYGFYLGDSSDSEEEYFAPPTLRSTSVTTGTLDPPYQEKEDVDIEVEVNECLERVEAINLGFGRGRGRARLGIGRGRGFGMKPQDNSSEPGLK